MPDNKDFFTYSLSLVVDCDEKQDLCDELEAIIRKIKAGHWNGTDATEFVHYSFTLTERHG